MQQLFFFVLPRSTFPSLRWNEVSSRLGRVFKKFLDALSLSLSLSLSLLSSWDPRKEERRSPVNFFVLLLSLSRLPPVRTEIARAITKEVAITKHGMKWPSNFFFAPTQPPPFLVKKRASSLKLWSKLAGSSSILRATVLCGEFSRSVQERRKTKPKWDSFPS